MVRGNHSDLQGLVAAYAIDAVEEDEVRIVEEHLATCPRCRAELQDMRDTAGYLAYAGNDAPSGLWDRIVGQLDAEPPVVEATIFPFAAPAESTKLRRWRIATLSAAAVATLLIAVNGVLIVRQSHRIDGIEPSTISALAERAAADGSSRLIPLRSADGAVTADVVVRPNGTAYLLHSTLPPLQRDETYQLWGIALGSQPVSLSVLGSAPRVVGFTAQMKLDQLAITVEKAGGVAVSKKSPLLVGAVS